METLKWKREKKVYQPRIKADKIKDLYIIGLETNSPMTRLVDEALEIYINNFFNMVCEPEMPDYVIENMFDEDWANLLIQQDQYAGENRRS